MNIEKSLTSLEVAEMVEKDHSKLLRDIRTYSEQLAEAKIGLGDFFEESTYLDANNQSRPCYKISKKGCEFIANKLTGVKGAAFTARYINRFHEMEETLKAPSIPTTTAGQIQLLAQGHVELEQKIDNVATELNAFKAEMPLLGVDMDVLKKTVNAKVVEVLGGVNSNAYKDKSVRGKVYSDCWNELKRQFGFVKSYKEMKRNQVEMAVAIVAEYEPPIVMKNLIDNANAQVRLTDC